MTPLHPAIVHFPPVLLLSAAVIYGLSIFPKFRSLNKIAFFFHVAGLLACIAAIFTGDYEADRIAQDAAIHEIVERHEFLGMLATYGFGMLGIWAFLRQKTTFLVEQIAFLVCFLTLVGIIGFGAHLGGEMVFEHGAGVEPMQEQLQQNSFYNNLNSNKDEE